MTAQGVEALKAALRRSLPLIVGCMLIGAIAVNVLQQLRGPRYEASARILISPTPLSNIITSTQPAFVDPERLQETAVGIAESDEVYELAASQSNEAYGDADQLKSVTTVTPEPTTDLISFSASDSDPDEAIGAVNAVTSAYIDFRRRLSSSQIERTIESLRGSLEEVPDTGGDPAGRLQTQLNKLLVLQENASDAQRVETASSAEKTSPAPLRDTLIGLSIGLIVALLAAALREIIDTRVRSEGDVEDLLAAPVLATVRTLPRRTRMVTYGRHQAEFGDAYALLAAQVLQPEPGDRGTVIAITSAISGEGKTTTAANLAVALARRGLRVALVDFDFRKPAQSDLFGLPEDAPGALQVMAGKADLHDTVWTVTLEGAQPQVSRNGSAPALGASSEGNELAALSPTGSLRLLPAGGAAKVPPPQARMGTLLRELRRQADVVVLDTPPALLTVEVAELSSIIDAILIVVRQGKVTQRNLRTLRRQARGWSANLAGAVVTDAPTEGSGYAYYTER